MPEFPVVDPHFHIWDITNNDYPWLVERPLSIKVAGDVDPIAKDYLIEDYLAEVANQGVVKAVHVDAGWNYADPVGETRWLQETADRTGFPHGIVARATLNAPNVEEILAEQASLPNVRGIRQIVNWHPDPDFTYIDDPKLMNRDAWRRGFSLLNKYGLSFDLQLYPAQMEIAAALAGEYVETSIILNHTGMPDDKSREGIQMWREGMRALARRDNVTVKLSGLGMLDWTWTTDSIRPFILDSIEIFGIERCMFASNFPVDRLYSSYDMLYVAFREIVRGLSADEQRALFHDNAIRIYRL